MNSPVITMCALVNKLKQNIKKKHVQCYAGQSKDLKTKNGHAAKSLVKWLSSHHSLTDMIMYTLQITKSNWQTANKLQITHMKWSKSGQFEQWPFDWEITWSYTSQTIWMSVYLNLVEGWKAYILLDTCIWHRKPPHSLIHAQHLQHN